MVWDSITVSKIEFSNSNSSEKLVATGVKINGQVVVARKEVILSASAIQSPTLLELLCQASATLQTYKVPVSPLCSTFLAWAQICKTTL